MISLLPGERSSYPGGCWGLMLLLMLEEVRKHFGGFLRDRFDKGWWWLT